MWMRHAVVLVGLTWSLCATASQAQEFRIEEAGATPVSTAQLKPGVIAFGDNANRKAADGTIELLSFEDWGRTHAAQKKFLALFPSYTEPTVVKTTENGKTAPVLEKLYMYVAQARFILDRPPAAVDLKHFVNVSFLERIDPAIKHKEITAAEVMPLNDERGTGNENPERKWCTDRQVAICIHSNYKFEGKIPIGILLVNKLRDSRQKSSRSHRLRQRAVGACARRRRPGRHQGADRNRYAGHRRARAEHLLCQSDHEVRQIPGRVPGKSDRA